MQLRPIPSDIGWQKPWRNHQFITVLTQTTVQHRAVTNNHSHSHSHLRQTFLTCMSLDCGRKPKPAREPILAQGKHANSALPAQLCLKARIFLLWGNGASHYSIRLLFPIPVIYKVLQPTVEKCSAKTKAVWQWCKAVWIFSILELL